MLDPATTKVEAHRRYMKSKASVVPKGFADMITEGMYEFYISSVVEIVYAVHTFIIFQNSF